MTNVATDLIKMLASWPTEYQFSAVVIAMFLVFLAAANQSGRPK